MARSAGHQPLSLDSILVAVTVLQAEAHVDAKRLACDRHPAHVAVAVLAALARRNVRTVGKVHKVGQVVHLGPAEWFAFLPGGQQPFYVGLALFGFDLDALVTTHALGKGGDTRHRAIKHARVTKHAGYLRSKVLLVVEADTIFGRGSGKGTLPNQEKDPKQGHRQAHNA